MSLHSSIFSENLDNDPSPTAIVALDDDQSVHTYKDLGGMVDTTCALASLSAGEVVVIVMPNCVELVTMLLAIWTAGAAAAPISPSYTASEIRTIAQNLGASKVCIMEDDEKVKNAVKSALPDIEVHEISLGKMAGRGRASEAPRAAVNRHSIALYLHTSGTTGKPKAVPLSQKNLLEGARNVAMTYKLGSHHRGYLLQVLFHIHGIVAGLLAPLLSGGSIVIPIGGTLNGSRAWFDFSENECNWVTGTPSILQTLLAAPTPRTIPRPLFIRSCSSPLLPTIFHKLYERFGCPIVEAYAMTEASHQMCSNLLEDFRPGCVGPESGSTRVCIWKGGTTACDPGEEGEVCTSGANIMNGYENVNSQVNDDAFWNGHDERGNYAKWFRTGDTGVLSTDGRRRLTLVGRLSEIVNRGGEKISPFEVDEALMLCSDHIQEAASFGVVDEFYGQEIEAAVVVRSGSNLDENYIQKSLEDRLAGWKIPRRIHFCDDHIPKGPTGKIQRTELSKMFSGQARHRAKETASQADVYTIIDEALGMPHGHSETDQNATLLQLGADSMSLSKISIGVKRRFNSELSMAKLFEFPTVAQVVELVEKAADTSAGKPALRPEPFSLLSTKDESLIKVCRNAGVDLEDLEDGFPLSAHQAAYFNVFARDDEETEMMWVLTRYRLKKGIDRGRIIESVRKLQEHEETLRWIMAKDAELGWIILQSRTGVEDRLTLLHYETEEEAKPAMRERLSSCRHVAGARTAVLFIVEVGHDLELAYIESHGFSEGPARTQILDSLGKIYHDLPLEKYLPYSSFVAEHLIGRDSERKLDFWRKERAASQFGESRAWQKKKTTLSNPTELSQQRMDLFGVTKSINAPFGKLCVELGMTLPLIVESVFALSLALYFSQKHEAFLNGSIVYDRTISVRTHDVNYGGLRAVTGSYLPNFLQLDIAHSSLWSYMQYFRAITTLREEQICVNSMPDLANNAVAFTWRFRDEGVQDPDSIITGITDEVMSVQAFKMCYVNANRNGRNGLTLAIGFHNQWLEEQRRSGCTLELIDILGKSLIFFAEHAHDLACQNLSSLKETLKAHLEVR